MPIQLNYNNLQIKISHNNDLFWVCQWILIVLVIFFFFSRGEFEQNIAPSATKIRSISIEFIGRCFIARHVDAQNQNGPLEAVDVMLEDFLSSTEYQRFLIKIEIKFALLIISDNFRPSKLHLISNLFFCFFFFFLQWPMTPIWNRLNCASVSRIMRSNRRPFSWKYIKIGKHMCAVASIY